MNYNAETENLGFCETVCEITSEQALDADISLPDYCPEIRRILKCTVDTNTVATQNSNSRITADVSAVVRLLYVGDDGNTAAYEQTYPLQRSAECASLNTECAVNVRIVTDYVNCRAVNPRRIDVRAMLTFIFVAVKKREESILCSASGAGVQTLSEAYNFSSLCGICERAFSVSEVAELNAGSSPISHIINIAAYAISTDIKIINNKALIKGDCFVKIHYIAEGSSSIETMEHIMPISQIIELDGVTEDCIIALRMNVISCEALPKVDSSGEMKLINLNIQISAMLAAFEEKNIRLITDAYSTFCEAENTQKSVELFTSNEKFDTSFTNKVVFESIGVSVDCVLSIWCSELKYNTVAKDDKCSINGNYKATIIYKDSDKQIGIIQKPVDFDYTFKLKNRTERIVCYGGVQIGSCSCSATGNSRLEVKTEMFASGIVLSSEVKKYICNININEEKIRKEKGCALTIYYADKNENIWDIARKFNTTVEAINKENSLSGDVTLKSQMLLIPSA